LIERGVIERSQLEEALSYQRENGGLLGQVLIHLKFADESEIALALTAQYGFPYLPLDNYEIDEELTKVVPYEVASRYCLVPIDRIGNALTLSMSDPTNTAAIEDVEKLTKCVVQTFVSTPSDIRQVIQKFYPEAKSNP